MSEKRVAILKCRAIFLWLETSLAGILFLIGILAINDSLERAALKIFRGGMKHTQSRPDYLHKEALLTHFCKLKWTKSYILSYELIILCLCKHLTYFA